MRLFAAVCVVASLLTGCAHTVPPTQAMDSAAQSLGPTSSAETVALAGFRAMLMEGDAKKAQQLFDDALARSNAEPLALIGQTFISFRNSNPTQTLTAALDLLERAPNSPLAPMAARIVADLAPASKTFSVQVRERVPKLLEKTGGPDVAHLLRLALANIAQADATTRSETLMSEMGTPTVGTLVGPFSPWHMLASLDQTPPEKDGVLEGLAAGPFGPLTPRTFQFADGHLSLAGEPSQGDVYVYAVDVTAPTSGRFVLRTVTSMDHLAILDGTPVLSRFTSQRPLSTLTTRALDLSAGTHRLLVRMTRESQAGQLTISLHRADGKPAGLTFAAATGRPTQWNGKAKVLDSTDGLYATAESARAALESRYGDALARVLAARDSIGRDRDGARALLGGLPDSVNGPAVAVLRAEVFLQDRGVPSRVARGRATRELEAALSKDPGFVLARLLAAELALEDSRNLDALEQARVARDAHQPASAPVLQLIARIELALGLDAAAASTAREAEAALPGYCEALLLQYDLAQRRDAVTEADALLGKTSACNGAAFRAAEHFKRRGKVADAIVQWQQALARDEGQVNIAITLAGLYVAQNNYDEATKLLTRLRNQWPRNAQLVKTLADVQDLSGNRPAALALREAALALDGSDLSLRRMIERQKTGRELLDAWAISTEEALKSYEAAPGSEDATSAFVLDAAAIQGFADGTMVDRVHIIQKALDQQGVQQIAEVEIPEQATVLTLRTIKPDGRSLEPERIEGKDGHSLPGVQVGDLVEYEYLLTHPTRGPGQPGFTASAFYFQIAGQPNARSSYVVIGPKGSNLEVDAHNVKAPKPATEGDLEVFRHEERRVPPYIPEPGGPPSGNEWLPFVSVGTGQRGNEGLVRAYADAFADRGLITWEVEQFAKDAVKDLPRPLTAEAVRAVYTAVQKKLTGRDAGLGVSAQSSVAQDRGSRAWLLKASLEALGFPTRLVVVRTFTADPAPYTFPNEGLLPYACLRVETGAGQYIWLDPLVHWAPYGELPEFARGGLEAWVLPEAGRALEQTKSPARESKPGKTVKLDLKLNEEGELSGSGVETYEGFGAAELAEALEALSEDQRNQALQSALSRYFGGADLSKLEVDLTRGVGNPVIVRYEFVARRFARQEGAGNLVASSLTFPLMLGRRFVGVPSRVTPLFLDNSERSIATATLTLPPGWSLEGPVGEVKLEGPSATYVRHEKQEGAVITVDEDFALTQNRISPKQYDAFGQFAGEVDLVQQRDLLFRKK